jgi:hypothetical protein
MANISVYYDSPMSDEERRGRLYAGDIFVFSPTPASHELADLGRAILAQAFAPNDPLEIQRHLTPEETAAILTQLKPKFIHHPECKRLIPRIMSELGVDLDSSISTCRGCGQPIRPISSHPGSPTHSIPIATHGTRRPTAG